MLVLYRFFSTYYFPFAFFSLLVNCPFVLPCSTRLPEYFTNYFFEFSCRRASAQLVGSNLWDTRTKQYDVLAAVTLFGNLRATSSQGVVVKVLPLRNQSPNQISSTSSLKRNDPISQYYQSTPSCGYPWFCYLHKKNIEECMYSTFFNSL